MEADLERGRRLGRKYVTMAFVVLAGLFVLSTTKQLSFGVFGIGSEALGGAGAGLGMATESDKRCGGRLRAMAAAVDRAIAVSAGARDEASAALQYQAALGPEWSDTPAVENSCSANAHGADALATVVRLRVAGEQVARRRAGELVPLRRDVATYLSP